MVTDSIHLPESPFPGADPYGYAYRAVFPARKDEVEELFRLIVIYRGVHLYAPSTCGKSSLLNAGLIPRLEKEGFQPERLRVQPRQGEEIVVSRIAETEDRTGPFRPSIFADDEGRSSEGQSRLVLSVESFTRQVRHAAAEGIRPVLMFDQFEEWVTLFQGRGPATGEAGRDDVRQRIAGAILAIVNDPDLPVKTLLSFREDFLASMDELFHQCPALRDNAMRLRPIPLDEIEGIIRSPFVEYPGAYQPELSPALAVEIARQFRERAQKVREGLTDTQQVGLTEVQIVCAKLFKDGRAESAAAGLPKDGVTKILEDYVENQLASLPRVQRDAARVLLCKLITRANTRAVVEKGSLLDLVAKEEPRVREETVEAALEFLAGDGKLVRSEHRGRDEYYEIRSEFFVEWIRTQAVQREDELRRRRRYRRLRRIVLASAAGGVVIVAGALLAHYIRTERSAVTKEITVSLAKDASAAMGLDQWGTNDADRARLLAVEAYHWGRTLNKLPPEVGQALLAAARVGSGPQWTAPDSLPIQSMVADTAGQLAMVLVPRPTTLNEQIASLVRGVPGTVWICEGNAPDSCRALSGTADRTHGVAFSQDGSLLAAGVADSAVRLWHTGQWSKPWLTLRGVFDIDTVRAVAISPDGRWVAAGGDAGAVELWRVGGRPSAPTQRLWFDVWRVMALAFSPDSRYLASAGADSTVLLWDLSRPDSAPRRLSGHTAWVRSLAFTPSGRWLASAGDDSTVRLWDLAHPESTVVLDANTDWVRSVAFSPNGRLLASAGDDDTVRVWRTDSLKSSPFAPLVETARLTSLVFTGRTTLTFATGDGTVGSWSDAPRVGDDSLAAILCQRVHRSLSLAEWRHYLQRVPYTVTCPGRPLDPSIIAFGTKLARGGKIDSALVWFRRIQRGDSALTDSAIDAYVWLGRLKTADSLVEAGAFDSVVRLTSVARDSTRGGGGSVLTPIVLELVTRAARSASDGKLAEATAALKAALQVDGTLTYDSLTTVCTPAPMVCDSAGVRAPQASRISARQQAVAAAIRQREPREKATVGASVAGEARATESVALRQLRRGMRLALRRRVGDAARAARAAVRADSATAHDSADVWLLGARALGVWGFTSDAVALFDSASAIFGNATVRPEFWNNTCWFGSLRGHAAAAMPACEAAVAASRGEGNERDSRGLARALLGLNDGAIEDFTYFVDSRELEPDAIAVRRRRRWIASLRAGINPFTRSVLDSLLRGQ